MAFEFSFYDYDLLADKLIAHESVLARDTILLFGVCLHEFSAQNLRVATVLHENTV